MDKYEVVRDQSKQWFQDWQGARSLAARTKFEALQHLDAHLIQFAKLMESRGTQVHWAASDRDARDIILGILRDQKARVVVKSKTMTSEEIHLNPALRRAGYEVVESDLGEYIVQLRHEPPYHLVFPAMHLTRGEIKEVFEQELHDAPSDDPADLTMVARRTLRKKFLQADVGITGANFAIADTGMISITENEGNARLTAALPRTLITLVGIEKILPRLEDLALFLPMLATMGTGQHLTCYNSLYAGPRQPGETDGPVNFHVILLDNQRTLLLADAEQRDALGCIRCGACLNVCPVFRNIGGHAYGTVYGGPIGSVITPHLRELQDWKHLSFASSLCGACSETCPVKIDLHHHLLQNRSNAAAPPNGRPQFLQQLAFRTFGFVASHPALWTIAGKLGRLAQTAHKLVQAGPLDPLRTWTKTRVAPRLARQSFRAWFKERQP